VPVVKGCVSARTKPIGFVVFGTTMGQNPTIHQ
jgi:hypothetical protein